MRVVPHLLCAMGNTAHKDSQKQSSVALKVNHLTMQLQAYRHAVKTHLL